MVRVTARGENFGVMPLSQALARAQQEGLDLVEVAPHFKPPVCSIMDYSQYKYEQSKRKKEVKQPQSKEVKLRPVSSDHDVDIRAEQIKRFLTEKRNVTVFVEYRGRQVLDSRERGEKIIQRILTIISEVGKLDQPIKMEGRRLIARFSPKGTV